MSTKSGYADHDPESVERDAPTEQFPTSVAPDAPTEQLPASVAPKAPTEQFRAGVPPAPPATESGVMPALLTAASSDRCGSCGAQLAPDQRYCVVCGERRGRARFAGAMFGPSASTAAAPEADAHLSGSAVRGSRFPPGATLIAGVLTLLVAMGLGILIGHDTASRSQVASKQQPISLTVNGGGALGAGSGLGTTGASSSSPSSRSTPSSSSAASKAAAKPASTAAQAKGAQAAVTKGAQAAQTVLGGGSVKTAAPTVQQGGACTPGSAGCTGKKFTGNFFGG
jgi:hypothetical protein